MKIKVGDKFVKDTTEFGVDFKMSWEIVDINYSWGVYGNLLDTICYKCSDPTGTFTDTVFEKSRQGFEELIEKFNARRIPKGEICNVQSYIPRHKFL